MTYQERNRVKPLEITNGRKRFTDVLHGVVG
jgi:hypothetical protein